jgi:hypothetical protein
MKANTFAVALLVLGVVLMYAAAQNMDPRDVIYVALGKTAQHPTLDGKAKAYGRSLKPTPQSGAANGVSGPNVQWVTV